MNEEKTAKIFANWLSAYYIPDNGIGYWLSIDIEDDDESFSTQELWDKFTEEDLINNTLYHR